MKWWEIPQNCNCTFALDATSKATSTKVFFANDPLRYLTLESTTNRVYNTVTTGLIHKNLKNEKPLNTHTYKSITVAKTNLVYDTPLLLPDNFTIVLKCKLKQSSVLMSNGGSYHGLTLGLGQYDQTDEGFWRIHGFNAGSEIYTKAQLVPFTGNYIQTVVLKGSISGRDITFKTDYGSFKIPVSSSTFTTGYLQNRTYSHMGYSTSENWKPNLDIIAYGVFDNILSAEEEANVFAAIEDQFFISKHPFSFNSNLKYIKENFKIPKETLKPKLFLKDNFLEISEPVEIFGNIVNKDIIKSNVITQQVLYSVFENIHDVVLEEGIPVQVKLFLYERNTGVLIKTTMSNREGVFSFLNLNKDLEYFITANDNKYQFQSVVKNYNN